jgi:hypothetical protein
MFSIIKIYKINVIKMQLKTPTLYNNIKLLSKGLKPLM